MIRLAIVGAGVMGANHGRVAMGLRDAQVSVVVDPDRQRGEAVAAAVGADYSSTVDGLSRSADAAVVAVPTHLHKVVAENLFRQGLSVLLEKPISPDVDSARALVATARDAGVVLLVGHIERFNPVVAELDRLIDKPIHFEATRISPFVSRIADGVILDLMIHDLDIVRHLAGGSVADVSAMARKTRSETEDLAIALLRFDNGITATMTASRVGQEKLRRLNITQEDSYLVVDLLKQDITLHRVEEVAFTDDRGDLSYRQKGVIEIPFLRQRGEPLYLELEHFVNCVRAGEPPRVSGDDGVAALQLAFDVMRAAGIAATSSS